MSGTGSPSNLLQAACSLALLSSCNAVLGLEESTLAQPDVFTLAAEQASPRNIAIDSTSIYWTNFNGGNVMKAPLQGGTPVALAVGQSFPDAIAASGEYVYWTASDGGQVMRARAEGGAALTLAADQFAVAGLAVLGSDVYWAARTDGVGNEIVVKRLSIGDATTELAVGNAPVAANATGVYYAGKAGLMKVPSAGGTPSTLAPLDAVPLALTIDSGSLYFTQSDGAVMQVPLEGGTPSLLAFGQESAFGIAVDATHVYWTTKSAVMRVALAGGAPEKLADADHAFGIVVDASSVYWTNGRNGGSVLRTTK
jgi:sugar lactone lactonase YvrE